MYLYEFAITVLRALLITSGHRTAGAHHRVCGLAKDKAWSTARDDHSIRRECLQLERSQIHRDQTATDLMVVQHQRHHFPAFIFLYLAGDLKPANLLVERIQKLLPGRSSGERRSVMLRA